MVTSRGTSERLTDSGDFPTGSVVGALYALAAVTSGLRQKPECFSESRYNFSMTPAPIKPVISMELLNQIDVRVGTILAVGDVPKSDKLVQLRVSFGDHERTIVAGLRGEPSNPREIEGKQALFVVNIASRTMCGVISEALLFDIGYADGVRPVLAVPESTVPDGTRAG